LSGLRPHFLVTIRCAENKSLTITYCFVELTLVSTGKAGIVLGILESVAWLANGWPNGIVNAHRRFGYRR
jgi:hypothetical protein